MPAPIILKIDVTKLRKEWFFKGKSGTYADLMLYANDQPDNFGNTHAIKQNPPKEQREAGEKGHYVGNGKEMQGRGQSTQRQQPPPQTQGRRASLPTQTAEMEDDDIPF